MQFVIEKSALVRELQTVAGVVERRATLPILANLLLETGEDGLYVGASDLEVSVRGKAPAKVSQQGGVTLPAAKLHEIARSLPDADVQFTLQDRNQVAITCKRVRYRISGQPQEEFPKFPEIDPSGGVTVAGPLLRSLVERVAFAITTEDPRYSLNGALLRVEPGHLRLVATDGHRLSYVSREVELSPPGGSLELIVPKKALGELAKLTSDPNAGETVTFGLAGEHVFFDVGDHRLTSTLLQGNFPRYENVMPESCGTELILPTGELADAVRRVSLVASERQGKAVRLALSAGKLEVSSETEMGEAHEELAVDYDSGEVAIGFNARYLMDFFGAVGTSSVKLGLNPTTGAEGQAAGDKPGQFTPAPDQEIDYRYIVMPMHL